MNIACPRCGASADALFCPSCGQRLVAERSPGTDEPGCAVHPALRSQATCSRCGAFACTMCLAEGGEQPFCKACRVREPAQVPLAWDQRAELGTLKAYWKSCLPLMLSPNPTLNATREDGSVGSSLLFAFLSGLAGYFTTGLLYVGLFGIIGAAVLQDTQAKSPPPAWLLPAVAAAFTVLGPLISMLWTLISAGIDHVILKMLGAAKPFTVTLRASALSQAPNIIGLIPLFGLYVFPWWSLVLRVIAYKNLHKLRVGQALVGALLAPVLSCLLCGGLYAAMLFAILKDKTL